MDIKTLAHHGETPMALFTLNHNSIKINVLLIDRRVMLGEKDVEMSGSYVKCMLVLGIHLEGLTAGPLSIGYSSPNGS